jgi:1-acyl-sn-glycerol-3-phosphate acyltransferase
MLKKFFGKTMLKIFGWKIVGDFPDEIKKAIIIEAPHTSNWDFLIGHLYNFATNMKPTVIVKKELFVFPLNLILKALGGMPIDRKSPKGFVEQMIDAFENKDFLRLVFTPEGTRKKNPNWKTGFLRVAYGAKVPIIMTYIDYKKKELGTLGMYQPKFNLELDMQNIKKYYKNITAKYPDKFAI